MSTDIFNQLLSKENRERCLQQMKETGTHYQNAKNVKTFASVLMLLCTNVQLHEISLLYTRRSHMLSRHMRQISFPGGIKEDNEDFIKCALRETEEEIGLTSERINLWGIGGRIIPPSSAAIVPVIGVVNNFQHRELKINNAEVEEAFTVPINYLNRCEVMRYTQFKSGYSSPVFLLHKGRIWGITGYLTYIFLKSFLPPHLNQIKNILKFVKPIKIS